MEEERIATLTEKLKETKTEKLKEVEKSRGDSRQRRPPCEVVN